MVARSNVSSAVLGGEGLFNLSLTGDGVLVCESYVPMEELIEIELENDTMKIDGNMAVAWSGSLDFTVEKAGKSLVGSAMSGEGFVNVYRGTGKILMAPTIKDSAMTTPDASDSSQAESTSGSSSVGKAVKVLGNVLDFLD